MPVLARFYGIVNRMYFLGAEHNPTHIHAIYETIPLRSIFGLARCSTAIFRPAPRHS